MMNYSDCEVKAYLFKKDEPLISKVEIDDFSLFDF